MKIFTKASIVSMVVSLVLFTSSVTWPVTALAATSPSLGTAGAYGVLSDTFTANGAQTTVTGDVGYTTLSGSGTILVSGTTHTPAPAQANTDAGLALSNLNTQSCTSLGTNVVLSGTYTPGCYSSTGTMDITLSTTVTLSGSGTYIFRSGGAITTGANSIVALANGASSCDVFWTPNGATTLGANSTFVGTVLPAAQDITVGNLTSWTGRALTFGHTVTTTTATINSTCVTASGPVPSASINVVKQVINDNGGTKMVNDFHLFVSGQPVASGVTNTFAANVNPPYAVTETPDSQYTATFSGDCDATGHLNINPGDNAVCIVTNNDIGAPAIPVVPPLIDVVKVPSPLALPGGPGPVIYTYTLRNVGTVPVTNVTMVGDTCSPITRISGDTNANSQLEVNETWVYTCTTTLSATHTNIVTATGWANGISASDVATATVVVGTPAVPPLIHVTKVPSPLALPAPGGRVTYTYTVTNPGTVALSNVSLVDNKCSPVSGHSGDLNNNNLLDVSETWGYTCQMNLTTTTVNTATAEGSANGFTARDIAIATVVVASPKLPNTGIASAKENNSSNIMLLVGLFGLFIVARKKQVLN